MYRPKSEEAKRAQAEYHRAYRERNRERINSRNREYRLANKELVKSRAAAYRIARRESGRERTDEYRKTHRATQSAYNKTPAGRMAQKRGQCTRYGIPFELTLEFFENVPDTCPQCSKKFGPSRDDNLSVDRIDPGKGYVAGNVEWICIRCNTMKRDMTYAQMLEFAKRGLDRTAK